MLPCGIKSKKEFSSTKPREGYMMMDGTISKLVKVYWTLKISAVIHAVTSLNLQVNRFLC